MVLLCCSWQVTVTCTCLITGQINWYNCLTQGTAYWKAPVRWCDLQALPPPPAEEVWSVSEVWPGDRWCVSVRRRFEEGWSLAGRGVCCLAWSLLEHPPWNSPGSWESENDMLIKWRGSDDHLISHHFLLCQCNQSWQRAANRSGT